MAKRKRKILTDEQVTRLTRTICGCGDDPVLKSAAMLILMDEILEQASSDEAHTARQAAFASLAEYHSEIIDAQVAVLRRRFMAFADNRVEKILDAQVAVLKR